MSARFAGLVAALLGGLTACSDYSVYEPPPVAPAEPPGDEGDDFGDPPDWDDCYEGYLGQYYNLPRTHPDLDPEDPGAEIDYTSRDWWDDTYLSFQRYDPSLDFGANWWPVDEGLADDPDYFSGRWTAWLRAWNDETIAFTLAAASDAWILIDDEVVGSITGSPDFEPVTIELDIDAGQYPLELRFAQRVTAESGFRFRVIQGETTVCYPEFEDSEE